jgi:acetyltransferase-like isoleucine patch superfamily enzyme
MPKYLPQPPAEFIGGENHHIPVNPYNPHCWITGEPDIGEGTWIGAFTLIDGQGGLSIGKGVDISCGAAILTHSTVKRCVTERAFPKVERKPVVIEDYVFIGENAVILMGCTIGHHSIIGAGAVVLEDTVIPPYSMVVGVPGRVSHTIEKDIEQWKQLSLAD